MGAVFTPMAHQSLMGQGLLIMVASRSHSDTPLSVGLLWTSDQPVAGTSNNKQRSKETTVYTPGGIRTHNVNNRANLDSSAIGIGAEGVVQYF